MGNPIRAKQAILEVVENQLRSHEPPETQQALDRLLAAGYTRQKAVELIATAVAEEIWQILHEKKPYDAERYKACLSRLGE